MKKTINKKTVYKNKWINLVSRDIIDNNKILRSFYSVEQQDYVNIIVKTPSGRFPLVQQFRHAINKVTIEFPSGLLEKKETLQQCAKKEVLEEIGCKITKLYKISTVYPDAGRLSNKLHFFYGETNYNKKYFKSENGIKVLLKTKKQIIELIKNDRFIHQPFVSLFYLALLKKYI